MYTVSPAAVQPELIVSLIRSTPINNFTMKFCGLKCFGHVHNIMNKDDTWGIQRICYNITYPLNIAVHYVLTSFQLVKLITVTLLLFKFEQ